MRAATIVGIVLIVLGAFLLIRPEGFTTKRDVLAVGDFKVTTEEAHPISPWISGVVLAAGMGLLVAGARRRA